MLFRIVLFFYKYLKNSSLLCLVVLLAFEFEIKKRNRIFEFYVFHYLRGFFGSRVERKMEFLMMNGDYKGPWVLVQVVKGWGGFVGGFQVPMGMKIYLSKNKENKTKKWMRIGRKTFEVCSWMSTFYVQNTYPKKCSKWS